MAKFELNPFIFAPFYTVLLIAIADIAYELIRVDRSSTKAASRLSTTVDHDERVNTVYAILFTRNAVNILFREIGMNLF